jgi:hypothetical protein
MVFHYFNEILTILLAVCRLESKNLFPNFDRLANLKENVEKNRYKRQARRGRPKSGCGTKDYV